MCVGGVMAATTGPTDHEAWDKAVADPSAAKLARPSKIQYDWQEMERTMFIQLDPGTIQGVEYDKFTTPLSKMTFEKLDVDEWCEIAKSWGAKQINYMATHSGQFCWWPSKTTDYHIGNTPYKGGKGDVLKEMEEACRRHGLKLGIYLFPDDPKYGSNGAGGRTRDAKKQQEYNALYRQRVVEALSRCAPDIVNEFWNDGGMVVPLGDLLAKYAPNAVVFQGKDPMPTIRWPGTELGKVRDPNWSAVKFKDLATGVATQKHDDPDGDCWAPNEADTPFHNTHWHWKPACEFQRKGLDQLMDTYIKSVGRNSLLLLNCAPRTDGSVSPGDKAAYKAFGAEIERRFGHPLAVAANVAGTEVVLDLGGSKKVDYSDLWEDYRYGHRIRQYVVEGFQDEKGQWIELSHGTAVGRRKIDPFPAQEVSKIRVRIIQSVGTPLIRKFQVHFGKATMVASKAQSHPWIQMGQWSVPEQNTEATGTTDLSNCVRFTGQYEVRFCDTARHAVEVSDCLVWMDGAKMPDEVFVRLERGLYGLSRTQFVADGSSTKVQWHIKAPSGTQGVIEARSLDY